MDSLLQKKDFQIFYSSIFLIADKDYLYRVTGANNFEIYERLHKFVLKLQHVLKQTFPQGIKLEIHHLFCTLQNSEITFQLVVPIQLIITLAASYFKI